MRFMILRRADPDTEAGTLPSEALLSAMGDYITAMNQAGILLAAEGLQPSAKSTLVRFQNGRPTVLDGPFAETKELIAGYCLIQVGSKQEALDWLTRWPALDGHGNVVLELRPLFEADDFGEEFTPELREAEERTRADLHTRTQQQQA
ncbi:YciI family protein [Neisseriaceae bacterium JH1-16]|nr:YciI family protein [Neisseriaceae bacterium JH1-16]